MTLSAVLRLLVLTACATGASSVPAWAQLNWSQPEETRGLEVTERLDQGVPAGLSFQDSRGERLTLDAALDDGLPTILTFNYSDCPMLCSMQLNGLVDSMSATQLQLGTDFSAITIGLDPTETPERAAETRARYYQELGMSADVDGWRFLLSDAETVRAAADAVGFGYRYVEETGEYAHAAVQLVLTPDGRISRYLYGVDVPGRDLRLALVEASEGRIGTTVDAFLLFCFHYDPGTGGYTFAWTTMRLGGVLTIAGLVGGLLWLRRARRAQAIDRAYA